MKKIMILTAFLPVLLFSQGFKDSTFYMLQMRECTQNAIEYGKLKGLTKTQVLNNYNYNGILSSAVNFCQEQIKTKGMVWNLPFEKEIEEARKRKERQKKREEAYKKRQEQKSILGTF